MKVNGRDIREFGARQQNVKPGFAGITNGSGWPEGASMPLMLPSEAGMKKLEVSVIIEGSSRQEIWGKASALAAALMEPSEIELDGFSNTFHMSLVNAAQAELALQRFHKCTLELIGYEHGHEETFTTGEMRFFVENKGSMAAPAIVEVAPMIGRESIRMTGLVRARHTPRPLVISRLAQGAKVVINGETGLVYEVTPGVTEARNKFKDVEMWGLPALMPGQNQITVSHPDVEVTIRHKPRYL